MEIFFVHPTQYMRAVSANPILAMPGVDLQAYEKATAQLAQQNTLIASYYPASEATTIKTALTPLSFLKATRKLEGRRRALLQAPSLVNSVKYAYALVRALRALRNDALTFERALNDYPLGKTVAFIDGTTDDGTLKKMAATIVTTAHKKESQAIAQLSCLFVSRPHCETTPSIQHVPSTKTQATPYDTQALSRQTAIHTQLSDYKETRGQLMAISSRCALKNEALFSVWYREKNGLRIREHAPLPDTLIISYDRAPEHPTELTAAAMRERTVSPALQEWLIERKVRYLYQPIGGLYYCAESGFDVGAVGRILGLQAEVSSFIPSSNPSMETLSSHLNKPILDTGTLGSALNGIIADNNTPIQTKNALVTTWRAGTAGFEEVLGAAAAHNMYILALLAHGDHVPTATLLLMRSYPSVYFQAFNETLYSSPIEFTKTKQRFSTAQFGIRTFEEVAAEVGTTTLNRELAHSFKVMDELLKATE